MDLKIIKAMMADENFNEVRISIGQNIDHESAEIRAQLYPIYFEALEKLSQHPKVEEIFSYVMLDHKENWNQVKPWLEKIIEVKNFDHDVFFLQVKMRWLEERGNLAELRKTISAFHLANIESKRPVVSTYVNELILRYFRHDFSLKLQQLALHLSLQDSSATLEIVKELLACIFERSTLKAKQEKLEAVVAVLRTSSDGKLVLYRNLCSLYVHGIREKKDYKSAAELVIYFDDFETQVLVLGLLQELKLQDVAGIYSQIVRKHQHFDFVYVSKFYPSLKFFFVKERKSQLEAKTWETPDLDLENTDNESEDEVQEEVPQHEDTAFINTLKHTDYSCSQLCEIAVSFLQSEMPKVAFAAADKALELAISNVEYLKAAYLKITSLMLLLDYRGAVDVAFEALQRASTQDDILSLMYAQAESYIKLGEKSQAKNVLKKILKINASYRMTRERLEKLNEI